MIVRLRRVPLTVVWIVVAICFAVPIVQSQKAATKAHHAAIAAQAVALKQQETIDRLGALVTVECARSTNSAILRQKLIHYVTARIASPPGLSPGGAAAIAATNRRLAAEQADLEATGERIPKVAC